VWQSVAFPRKVVTMENVDLFGSGDRFAKVMVRGRFGA
jgi:hypothetical protein